MMSVNELVSVHRTRKIERRGTRICMHEDDLLAVRSFAQTESVTQPIGEQAEQIDMSMHFEAALDCVLY